MYILLSCVRIGIIVGVGDVGVVVVVVVGIAVGVDAVWIIVGVDVGIIVVIIIVVGSVVSVGYLSCTCCL